jgi:hypothetical protein
MSAWTNTPLRKRRRPMTVCRTVLLLGKLMRQPGDALLGIVLA